MQIKLRILQKTYILLICFIFASFASSIGLLTDLVCDHDTTKKFYIVNDGEQCGWRVIQIIRPYIVIAFWNYNSWFDCYPCLIHAKESYWQNGEYKALKRLDWVPEIKLVWEGIKEVILEDGFYSTLPVLRKVN